MEDLVHIKWKDFIDGKIAINCGSPEHAEEFLNKVSKHCNIKGVDDWDFTMESMWEVETENTVYRVSMSKILYFMNAYFLVKYLPKCVIYNYLEVEFVD